MLDIKGVILGNEDKDLSESAIIKRRRKLLLEQRRIDANKKNKSRVRVSIVM